MPEKSSPFDSLPSCPTHPTAWWDLEDDCCYQCWLEERARETIFGFVLAWDSDREVR